MSTDRTGENEHPAEKTPAHHAASAGEPTGPRTGTGHRQEVDTGQDPRAYWEERYGQSEAIWSGKVNATTAAVVQEIGLPSGPVRPVAVDLGCGEGGDVLWLAEHGWQATGIDISATAAQRGRRRAQELGLGDSASFLAQDLSEWEPEEELDLVSASFFQSPVPLERVRILRRAAAALRPGGHLVVVSHGAVPPWAPAEFQGTVVPTPQEQASELDPEGQLEAAVCEIRTRAGRGPDGQEGVLDDAVVVLRKPRR